MDIIKKLSSKKKIKKRYGLYLRSELMNKIKSVAKRYKISESETTEELLEKGIEELEREEGTKNS